MASSDSSSSSIPKEKRQNSMFMVVRPILLNTLRLHYNGVLYNADSIITWSPHGSQIFFQYTMCENVSRRSRYTQCKLWKSYSLCISLPSFTPVNLVIRVNRSLNIQCWPNRGECVIKRRLSNLCLQNKTTAACGKRDNDGLQCRWCL